MYYHKEKDDYFVFYGARFVIFWKIWRFKKIIFLICYNELCLVLA